MELAGKTAIITGGAGGIGLASARRFLEAGAEGILLVGRNRESLREASEALGSDRVRWEAADVSRTADVRRYTQKAVETFGRIDILFLNAGILGEIAPLEDYDEAGFEQVFDINVKGVWLGLKYAFPVMRQGGGGSVIITSSAAGLKGTMHSIGYNASKHAVVGVMRVAALEGAADNIRVNTIHPGPVDNRMVRLLEQGLSPDDPDQARQALTQKIPLGRYVGNEDVAELVLYLASDASSCITGSLHRIDGGQMT